MEEFLKMSNAGVSSMKDSIAKTISDLKTSDTPIRNFDGDLKAIQSKFDSNLAEPKLDEEFNIQDSELFNFDSLEKVIEDSLPSLDSLASMLPDVGSWFNFK